MALMDTRTGVGLLIDSEECFINVLMHTTQLSAFLFAFPLAGNVTPVKISACGSNAHSL